MPTSTYVALATVTLASTDSEIVFSSIPATYRDLILVVNTGSAMESIDLRPNAATSDRTSVHMVGYGASTSESYTLTNFTSGTSGSNSRLFIYNIMDYAQTNKHKTILGRLNVGTFHVGAMAGRWASTTAISSLNLVATGTAFPIGAVASLYGVN